MRRLRRKGREGAGRIIVCVSAVCLGTSCAHTNKCARTHTQSTPGKQGGMEETKERWNRRRGCFERQSKERLLCCLLFALEICASYHCAYAF